MEYKTIASGEKLEKVIEALNRNNIEAVIVDSKVEALEIIKKSIPEGASINNGSSTTLAEIGFVDILKSNNHSWRNIHGEVLSETDEGKKKSLQREQSFADYYLGSVHAITENGELIFASASGSQMPHLVYTSQNLILVAGAQKIVKDIADGLKRIGDFVVPLEDERMKGTGAAGTTWAKTFILNHEPDWSGRKIKLIIVKEILGF